MFWPPPHASWRTRPPSFVFSHAMRYAVSCSVPKHSPRARDHLSGSRSFGTPALETQQRCPSSPGRRRSRVFSLPARGRAAAAERPHRRAAQAPRMAARHCHVRPRRRHKPVRHPPGWCNAAAVCNPCSASRRLVLRRMARIIRSDSLEDHEPTCGKGECSGALHSRVVLQCAGSWAAAHSPRLSSSPPCSRHNGSVCRSSRLSPAASVQAPPCTSEAKAAQAHCSRLQVPPPALAAPRMLASRLHLHGLSIAQRVCAHRR